MMASGPHNSFLCRIYDTGKGLPVRISTCEMGTMLLLRGSPAAVRNADQGVSNRGLCDPLAIERQWYHPANRRQWRARKTSAAAHRGSAAAARSAETKNGS